MTRKYKTHSGPHSAGIKNMPKNYETSRKDVNKTMKSILPITENGFKHREDYKGLWDEYNLAHEVNEYFKYCSKKDIKPAKAGVRLWLDLSRTQYHEWETGNHGFKTDILERAAAMIELSYIGRIESFPTGNIFLLKSSHNHSDKTEIEFTGNDVDPSNIKDMIAKMGLAQKD